MTSECRSTLIWRERREALSTAERQALEAHLEQCAACRDLRLMLGAFDPLDVIEREDGVRIQAMALRAEQYVQRHQEQSGTRQLAPAAVGPRRTGLRSNFRSRRYLAAAALVLLSGVASAGLWYRQRGDVDRAGIDETIVDGRSERTLKPAGQAQATASNDVPKGPLAESSAPAPPAVTDAPTGFLTDTKGQGVHEAAHGAAGLFREGNSARKAGRSQAAIALYRRLQRSFPTSAEAGLSHVSLGSVLLELGQPKAALTQFGQALSAPGAASVRAEAWYGKGQAHAALRQRDRERSAWSALVDQYPSSPYAAHASRRLDALGRE